VRATFEYAPGIVSYTVTSEATIAEVDSGGASASRVFREVARVVLTIVRANGNALVTTTGSIDEGQPSIMAPFVDTLRIDGTGSIPEPGMPICGRDTVPPAHLVTLLPPVPLELREGLRWERRNVYATCQGKIPIRVERTDSYIVTGSARQVPGGGVTVARNSSLKYAGAGVEGQHNVRISGSGSAQATLVLDASAGRLVSAGEEINSEIDIAASGRIQRFTQHVVRTISQR